MITVDPAAGIDENDVVATKDLITVGAMRKRGRRAEGDDAECRAGIGAGLAMLPVDEIDHLG